MFSAFIVVAESTSSPGSLERGCGRVKASKYHITNAELSSLACELVVEGGRGRGGGCEGAAVPQLRK